MSHIQIKCEGCKEVFNVDRDKDAPEDATSMECNWCPACADKADDYYCEWYCFDPLPDPVDPDQMDLFETNKTT